IPPTTAPTTPATTNTNRKTMPTVTSFLRDSGDTIVIRYGVPVTHTDKNKRPIGIFCLDSVAQLLCLLSWKVPSQRSCCFHTSPENSRDGNHGSGYRPGLNGTDFLPALVIREDWGPRSDEILNSSGNQ